MNGPAPRSSATDGAAVRAEARGAAGRVAEVHAQTRRGLVVTAAFAAAGVVTAITGVGRDWWLPLHLFVAGGLLSAISAVTQMLAVTWSAAAAPRATVVATQRWLLAAGTIGLVTGRETDRTWMFTAGGVAVVGAMLGLAAILLGIRRAAVTPRFAPAIEAYVAAVVAGAAGMTIGIFLGAGRGGSKFVELRDVHLTLNLFGLVGLVVAGTLPFFAATQVRTKMSPYATPNVMRTTSAVLTAATGITAVGHLTARPGIAAAGLSAYALGLLAVGAILPIYARSRLSWAGPRLLQLTAGLVWWAAMTVGLAVTTLREASDRAVLQTLVIGGFAQILIASLAYLGPVLRGGGHRQLTAGFTITRSWVSLAAGNAAALAALAGRDRILVLVLAIWLADLVLRTGRLLGSSRGGARV
ncbi:hypothetical protein [Desertimonas flava]|uniref:hypothetical protein n=1 Tax=Desertimonas flava TaxID=2064846 RepID=UPI0013C411D1|nr:hypothetical protein [Desertimonas flava]